MTCPNYIKEQGKPFCRAYNKELTSEKEKSCLGQYASCLEIAEKFMINKRKEELEAIRKPKESQLEIIPSGLGFSISHPI